MKNLFLATAAAVATLSAGSAQATVIDFDTSSNINTFTGTYTQSGYNITYVSGGLRLLNDNPTFGDILAGRDAAGGSFDLTRSDGGLFSIESFFGSSGKMNTDITYSLLGYLAGASTYSQTLSRTATSIGSSNLIRFDPTPTINKFDRINFSMRSSQSSPAIDNINVTEIAAPTPPVTTPDPVPPVTGAVPEPATWAMMILGFGLIGGAMRRRRYQVAFRYA